MENTTNHGENTSQNNELAKRKKIEGTPFYINRQTTDNDKHIYFLTFGDYRLTEPTETEKETTDKLITDQWLITTRIIAITTEKMIEKTFDLIHSKN